MRPCRIFVSVPADGGGAAVPLDIGKQALIKPEARSRKVGDNAVFARVFQNRDKFLVHVGVASASERDLKSPAAALVYDLFKVVKRHVFLGQLHPILVTLNAGQDAKPAYSMRAMAHDPDIQKLGEAAHERVGTGVVPVLVEHVGPYALSGIRIKQRFIMVFFVS